MAEAFGHLAGVWRPRGRCYLLEDQFSGVACPYQPNGLQLPGRRGQVEGRGVLGEFEGECVVVVMGRVKPGEGTKQGDRGALRVNAWW